MARVIIMGPTKKKSRVRAAITSPLFIFVTAILLFVVGLGFASAGPTLIGLAIMAIAACLIVVGVVQDRRSTTAAMISRGRLAESVVSPTSPPASDSVPAAQGAPAGWYSDPQLAHTQRYWDGSKWTDNLAPADASNRFGAMPATTIHRLSWAIAALFWAPALLLTANGVNASGIECGWWTAPRFANLTAFERSLLVEDAGGGALGRTAVDLATVACAEEISDQRAIVLVLLGLGGGVRIGAQILTRGRT